MHVYRKALGRAVAVRRALLGLIAEMLISKVESGQECECGHNDIALVPRLPAALCRLYYHYVQLTLSDATPFHSRRGEPTRVSPDRAPKIRIDPAYPVISNGAPAHL